MIQVENILMDAFSTIEAVSGYNKLFYHFGEQKELDAVLITRQKGKNSKYPLLWYLMPNELSFTNNYVEGDFRFVLAHNTKLDWFNDQRFKQVFNKVLQPNFDLVLAKLNTTPNVSVNKLSNGSKYRYTNYPNYGNPTKTKAKSIDYWDAIGFTLNLRIRDVNEKC